MATVIEELLVAIGYEFDDGELEQFEQSTQSLVSVLKVASVAAFAAAAGISALVKTTAEQVDVLTKQARLNRIAVEELDALRFAQELTTGTTEGMSEALATLSRTASEAGRGIGVGVEAFGLLGVEVADANGQLKTSDTLILEVAAALNSLEDQGQRLELAEKLGLGQLDLLLREGSAGIRRLTEEAKELGVVTAEDGKAAEELNDAMSRLNRTMNAVSREITTALSPAITEVINGMSKWFKENRELITKVIVFFVEQLATLAQMLSLISDLFLELAESVGGFETAIRILGAALVGLFALKFAAKILVWINLLRTLGITALIMQARMFLIPIAIGALATAIGLMLEDVHAFFRGADSLTGELLNKFPKVKEVVKALGDAFTILKDASVDGWKLIFKTLTENSVEDHLAAINLIFEDLYDWVSKLGSEFAKEFPLIMAAIDPFVEITKFLFNTWVKIIDLIAEAVRIIPNVDFSASTAGDFAQDILLGQGPQSAANRSLGETDFNMFQRTTRTLIDALGLSSFLLKPANEIFPSTVNTRTNAVSQTNNINITTGADARDVRKELNRVFTDTRQTLSTPEVR